MGFVHLESNSPIIGSTWTPRVGARALGFRFRVSEISARGLGLWVSGTGSI